MRLSVKDSWFLELGSLCLEHLRHYVTRIPDRDANGTWVVCIHCRKYRLERWNATRISKGPGRVPHLGEKESAFPRELATPERNALLEYMRRKEGLIPRYVLERKKDEKAEARATKRAEEERACAEKSERVWSYIERLGIGLTTIIEVTPISHSGKIMKSQKTQVWNLTRFNVPTIERVFWELESTDVLPPPQISRTPDGRFIVLYREKPAGLTKSPSTETLKWQCLCCKMKSEILYRCQACGKWVCPDCKPAHGC